MPKTQLEIFKLKSGQLNIRYPDHKVDALKSLYGADLPRLLRGCLDELLADGLIHRERERGNMTIQRETLNLNMHL